MHRNAVMAKCERFVYKINIDSFFVNFENLSVYVYLFLFSRRNNLANSLTNNFRKEILKLTSGFRISL